MNKLRFYRSRPFHVAVLHGGPGAPGEMAPVAKELALVRGVLEPLQTADSVDGQVRELHTILKENADLPVILIGWSWGAMLAFIFTARHPSLVTKLILISSSPYEDKYASNIMKTRLSRLNEAEKVEVLTLLETLDSPLIPDKNIMARFGQLMSKADSYDPLPYGNEILECRHDVYQKVWPQASELRNSGKLLALGRQIRCPVVAIHGNYDPHPPEGVKEPLSRVLKDFRFILLENCGHHPWLERGARDRFYHILKSEIE